MALINCPDCGTEVSDAAPACPKCGRPIASVPSPANVSGERTRGRSHATVTVTLSSFVLIVLAIAAAVWFVPSMEIGQNLEARCQVNGMGNGSCQFTNTGWTPGAQCVDVSLRNKQGGAAHSGAVCSGRVWPNDTVQKNVMIAIGNTCDNALGVPDLSDICTMDVNNADSDDAGAGPLSTEGAAQPSTDAAGGGAKANIGGAEAVAPSASSASVAATPIPAATSLAPAQASNITEPTTATSAVDPAVQPPITDASGPSFDCSKVTDAAALTICSNDELSQLDRQMAALYFARAQSTDDTTARDEQRMWLHDRNQCGADAICLQKEYAARIQQLQQ